MAGMEGSGDNRVQGIPAWVGPLVIGVVLAAAASFFGAAQGAGSEIRANTLGLATLKTAFDSLCEQIIGERKENRETNKRQDETLGQHSRELQQIRSHLRLPPP
jgi:hypothetical protein